LLTESARASANLRGQTKDRAAKGPPRPCQGAGKEIEGLKGWVGGEVRVAYKGKIWTSLRKGILYINPVSHFKLIM